jgi:hypothetical protein
MYLIRKGVGPKVRANLRSSVCEAADLWSEDSEYNRKQSFRAAGMSPEIILLA